MILKNLTFKIILNIIWSISLSYFVYNSNSYIMSIQYIITFMILRLLFLHVLYRKVFD